MLNEFIDNLPAGFNLNKDSILKWITAKDSS